VPTLPTQSFSTIVQNTAAGIQGRAGTLLNFSIGSVFRAIAEGFAGVFLWFQALALQLLTAIRLNTSTGIDVDTFTADFMPLVAGTSSPRLGAQAASGQVVLARLSAGPSQVAIAVGSTVQTFDRSQTFTIVGDPTYPTYNSFFQGYYLQPNIPSIVVPVQAVVPGSAGNVGAGTITLITSTIIGLDTVNNPAALTNGADQESDAALKARFAAYILGLSRGDLYGVESAILGTGVTVQYDVVEDYNLDGSWHSGYFYVIADDGSGAPSNDFLTTVANAVNAVRPLGTMAGVFPPTVIQAAVSMIVTVAPTYDEPTVEGIVAVTVANNINALGLGNSLPWSQIAAWAYSVAGVTSVSAVLLNSQSGDAATLSATRTTLDGFTQIPYATIKCSEVLVS
jgi:uncharacterized phage protein gp47/JayE